MVTAQAALQPAGDSEACVHLLAHSVMHSRACLDLGGANQSSLCPEPLPWTLTRSSWSQGGGLSVGVMVKGTGRGRSLLMFCLVFLG